MQGLRLHGAGDVRLEPLAEPVAGPGEELVAITAVGLCGSDLHWYAEGSIGGFTMTRPFVLGHEMGGVIASGPRAGTRVAIDPADPCERCELCIAGHTNLCPSTRFCGTPTQDGALVQRMAWPSRLLVPVPDTMSDEEVPLLESLGIAIHGVNLGHVRPGMRAGVYGAGPIGLLLVALLRARGVARIVVTEPLPHRRAAALRLGADVAIDVDADGVGRAAAADEPVDVAFEAAGETAAIETACLAVRAGGRVVLVGIPHGDSYVLPAGPARFKGLTFPVARRMQAPHLQQAVNLVHAGVVDLRTLVTSVHPLAEGPAAFAALARRDGLKVVIRPDR
ncbi:MAG: alcohol dehydrogenase catalytic domain-containing protein [Chloroflexota bacterium]